MERRWSYESYWRLPAVQEAGGAYKGGILTGIQCWTPTFPGQAPVAFPSIQIFIGLEWETLKGETRILPESHILKQKLLEMPTYEYLGGGGGRSIMAKKIKFTQEVQKLCTCDNPNTNFSTSTALFDGFNNPWSVIWNKILHVVPKFSDKTIDIGDKRQGNNFPTFTIWPIFLIPFSVFNLNFPYLHSSLLFQLVSLLIPLGLD